jgi:hypothetical protein
MLTLIALLGGAPIDASLAFIPISPPGVLWFGAWPCNAMHSLHLLEEAPRPVVP